MSVNLPVRAVQSVRRTTATLTHALLACCLVAVAASSVADQHVPVEYQGHSTAISVAEGQVAITVPGAPNLGDFLIAQIALTGGTNVDFTAVPENWHLLVRDDQTTELTHAIFYKVVGNAGTIPAPGTTYQWVFSPNISSAVSAITRYSGVDFNNAVQTIRTRKGKSTAMIAPGVSVEAAGNVINLYAMGALADLSAPGQSTLRYALNNPDPVTAAMKDYQVEGPTSTSNDVVLGHTSESKPWVTHTVAVRARTESLADPANSLIDADPVEITADGTSTSTITVQVRNSDGQNLGNGGDTVILFSDAGTLLGNVIDNDDGTYTQLLESSTQINTATITGTVNGFDILDTATVNFVAGDVDALHSTIAAADSQLPADGTSSTTITVQVRDAFGNPVAAAGLPVTLSTTLGSLNDESGATDGDGRFQTSLTSSTTADTAVVSGTLDGNAIGNTASIEFIATAIDPQMSTITVDDSQLTANGTDSTTVTVQLRDASGNEVSEAGVNVQVFAELGSLVDTSGPTDGNGRFITTLTAPTTVGIDTISGRVLGADIGNTAQVEYVAGIAAALAFGLQPADTPAGDPISTTVRVVDANGNLVESASHEITLQLTHPGDATLFGTTLVSAVDGVASFSGLSVDIAGLYTFTASSNPSLIAAVSNTFRIDAGDASGTNSEISADPDEIIANGVSTSTITVQAKDAFGNPVSDSDLFVTLLTTLGTLAETSGTTNANGQFITTLTSATSTGTATVSGTLEGDAIGNFATVDFVDVIPDAGASTIAADDDELQADGESSTVITVQVRDADGLPMAEPGLPVTLSTSLGTLTDTGGTTDANGQFITTLTSETMIGTAQITGTLSGQPIGNSASVEFVQIGGGTGVATALNFAIQPANSVENFPLRGPVAVEFVDDDGVPVLDFNAEITIEILEGPQGATPGGSTTLMSEDGFAIFSDLTLYMVGEYRLRATSDNMNEAQSVLFQVREDRLMHNRFEQ